jgi:hypothetical protein
VQLTVNQLVAGSIPASGAKISRGDNMSDGGKGSSPRPFSVPKEVFDERFETIFGKKKKTEAEKFDDAIMKDEYYDLEDPDRIGN